MNLPIDTCDNGSCAFTLRVGYDAKCLAANVGLGGGISRRRACAWCINAPMGIAGTLTYHNFKGGWSNFLGTGSSEILSTAVIEIWEI